MRTITSGHRYALDNINDPNGSTILQFYMDPALHEKGAAGPSCQEVLRAVIARVQALDGEKPWCGNARIVQLAREMIALFEVRALLRKTEKGLAIEALPVGDDGHLRIEGI